MGRRTQVLARWTLLASASLGLVCGLVLMALGLWTMQDKAFLEELLRNKLYMDSTYVILVTSVFMIVLSGFGCFAAMKEIKCFLLTYFVVLFLLSIILMVAGALAYVFREQVQWTMKAEMVAEVRNYTPGARKGSVTLAWDLTQAHLQCCGLLTEKVDQPWQIWRYNQLLNPEESTERTLLPASCCPVDHQGDCLGSEPRVHTGDCFLLGLDYLRQHANTLGAAAIAVTCLMIPVMASALVMIRSIV